MAATIPHDEPPKKDPFGFPMDDDRRDMNGDGATTAVADKPEPGEQLDLIPDLDKSNPGHKALIRAARKYSKAKGEREALLSTSKENCDGLMQKLIGLMHEHSVTKFKHDGLTCELIATKEKVNVSVDDDAEQGDDDDE